MANTKKKTGRPATKAAKRAATKHFAGNKVGPHEPFKASLSGCDGPFTKDPQACKPAETVEDSNARGIKAAYAALKSKIDALLAANGIKVYEVQDGKPLPEELQATVDAAIRMGMMVHTGETLNATEALYAFTGWLTTRPAVIHMGSNASCGAIAELLAEFVKIHSLPQPRPDYGRLIVPMADVLPDLTNTWPVNVVGPTRDQAAQAMMGYLFQFSDGAQNAILANILGELKERRAAEYKALQDKATETDERKTQLADADGELNNILHGDFTIVRQ